MAKAKVTPDQQDASVGALNHFLQTFIGYLASDEFSNAGNLCAYLDQSDDVRSGDEASIVDSKISTILLKSLGYADKEWNYNAQKAGLRPDYSVKIKEYPREACFIIEDKSTTEEALSKHRPQLQAYMTQRGAPRGILMNGRTILVYDHLEGGLQTPAIELPLQKVVLAWRGQFLVSHKKSGIDALEEANLLGILTAFWRRFRRDNFAILQGLIDDLTLQSEKGAEKPHSIDGKTWTPALCRLPIVKIDDSNASYLTDTIKSLISEFEDDADAQFAAIEADYEKYCVAGQRLPNDNTALAVQENVLLEAAAQLMAGVDKEVREDDLAIIKRVMRDQVGYDELEPIKHRLYRSHQIKFGKGTDKDPIHVLFTRVRVFTEKRHRYLLKLGEHHKHTLRTIRSYESWSEKTASLVFQSEDQTLLRREFLAQTAYLVIIRLLLVRIMEDKGLVNRMFTNGGLAVWFRDVEAHYLKHAMGRSADFLLNLAYTSAQHIYSHFYAENTVLDWYVPDRNAVVRVLHKLAGFDLSSINRDIIGAVYNQYVENKHKHESGLYFTPPAVVSFMLDRIGYSGTEIIGKRLIDLSCGSGGFLVEAANRLVAAYKAYFVKQNGKGIPASEVQAVLDAIRQSLYGIDLNPFACALAETNLLIQVIDLFTIAHTANEPASIDRFNIYNSDSLTFSADTLAVCAGALPFPEGELPIEDQIKGALGNWRDKFDFVVGNPPYVRADENDSLRAYRERVKSEFPIESVRTAMTQKWDLFVPFVALSLHLLKSESGSSDAGRMAIITSNGIETVPYAEALRLQLVNRATVKEVHFFPDVYLFDDAAVLNTITIIDNRVPTTASLCGRYWHDKAPAHEGVSIDKQQKLPQLNYLEDVFRQVLPSVKLKKAVVSEKIDDLFYISVGMVLNADEKKNKGAFTIDDLISVDRDAIHCAPFAGSKDVDFFGIRRVRYLEYGPETRVPDRVRRPTFPELYDRPKLMVAEFGGFSFDDGEWDDAGFLKCNHSVFILMPWHRLAGISNKSINKELDKKQHLRASMEARSATVDVWYVLAFLNSTQMRTLLSGVTRSAIEGRLQPDDLREISIPMPTDKKLIKTVADIAKKAAGVQKALMPLRKKGWEIEPGHVLAPIVIPANISTLTFDQARVKWKLSISNLAAKVDKITRDGLRLLVGKNQVAALEPGSPEEALEWLVRQMKSLPAGTTLEQLVQLKVPVPESPAAARIALRQLQKNEADVLSQVEEVVAARSLISKELESLFEVVEHPLIH